MPDVSRCADYVHISVLEAAQSDNAALRKKLEEAEAEREALREEVASLRPDQSGMNLKDRLWTKDYHLLVQENRKLAADLAALRRESENMPEVLFVRHIEGHLRGNEVPICKICGFSILEIAEAARLSRKEEK